MHWNELLYFIQDIILELSLLSSYNTYLEMIPKKIEKKSSYNLICFLSPKCINFSYPIS